MTSSVVVATHVTDLSARVETRKPLLYSDGPDEALDRPAHVRAGSAVARLGDKLAVVQDDANFVAMVDTRSSEVMAITLPAGPGDVRLFDEKRGNKADKLDLEASVLLPTLGGPLLVAIGSGSLPARERFALVFHPELPSPVVKLFEAHAFYEHLRARTDFSGSELNLEGAALSEEGGRPVIYFFQRGNGAPKGELSPVDAIGVVDALAFTAMLLENGPAPELERVTQYDLGAIDGVRLTFTDACTGPKNHIFFLAAAEDTINTYEDGPVKGVALGIVAPDGSARLCQIFEGDGSPLADKAEGLSLDPARGSRAHVVVDKDDPDCPSDLCTLRLAGPWPK